MTSAPFPFWKYHLSTSVALPDPAKLLSKFLIVTGSSFISGWLPDLNRASLSFSTAPRTSVISHQQISSAAGLFGTSSLYRCMTKMRFLWIPDYWHPIFSHYISLANIIQIPIVSQNLACLYKSTLRKHHKTIQVIAEWVMLTKVSKL